MLHPDSPTTVQHLPGVVVTEDRTESGSGTYDVSDRGTELGYIYAVGGGQWAAVYTNTGDSVAEIFLRAVDAVNHMVLAHRYA